MEGGVGFDVHCNVPVGRSEEGKRKGRGRDKERKGQDREGTGREEGGTGKEGGGKGESITFCW
jgi:hypothetical protein